MATTGNRKPFASMSDAQRSAIMRNWALLKLAYHGAHVVGALHDCGFKKHSRKLQVQIELARADLKAGAEPKDANLLGDGRSAERLASARLVALAVEFGYKCSERGGNLESALAKAREEILK